MSVRWLMWFSWFAQKKLNHSWMYFPISWSPGRHRVHRCQRSNTNLQQTAAVHPASPESCERLPGILNRLTWRNTAPQQEGFLKSWCLQLKLRKGWIWISKFVKAVHILFNVNWFECKTSGLPNGLTIWIFYSANYQRISVYSSYKYELHHA